MKIITWNINGIRTLPKKLSIILKELDADIVCFQETKLTKDQLDYDTAVINGYNSFFSFSEAKNGYSGVAIYCKDYLKPIKAEDSLSSVSKKVEDEIGHYCCNEEEWLDTEILQSLDMEGRSVMIELENANGNNVVVFCVYCPNAGSDNAERMEFKINYHNLLQLRAETLIAAGKSVIIAGDINISHLIIDHCATAEEDDTSYSSELHQSFLAKPLRHWINNMLVKSQKDTNLISYSQNNSSCYTPVTKGSQFTDAFRKFYPDRKEAYTCWCSRTGARKTNFGNRIDYILVSSDICDKLEDSNIHPDIMGSDHCPVSATFSDLLIQSPDTYIKLPRLCAKYHPEFSSKQKKISDFFSKNSNNDNILISKTDKNVKVRLSSKEHNITNKCISKLNSSPKQATVKSFFKSKSKQEDIDLSKQAKNNNDIQQLEYEPDKKRAKIESSQGCNASTSSTVDAWKSILRGPEKPPLCKGHQEPCLLRTVKKDGPTKGKQFWVCSRPEGSAKNAEARCGTFLWTKK